QLRTAGRRVAAGGGRAAGRVGQAGAGRIAVPEGPAAEVYLNLQTGPARRRFIQLAGQEQAAAVSSADRRSARVALCPNGRDAAGTARASLQRGRPGPQGGGLLAQGRAALPCPLGGGGSDRTPDEGNRADRAPRGVGRARRDRIAVSSTARHGVSVDARLRGAGRL